MNNTYYSDPVGARRTIDGWPCTKVDALTNTWRAGTLLLSD